MAVWAVGAGRARELAAYALTRFDAAVAGISGVEATRQKIEATVLSWENESLGPKDASGVPVSETVGKAGYTLAINALVDGEVAWLKAGGAVRALPNVVVDGGVARVAAEGEPAASPVGSPVAPTAKAVPKAEDASFETAARALLARYEGIIPALKEAFFEQAKKWAEENGKEYGMKMLESQLKSMGGREMRGSDAREVAVVRPRRFGDALGETVRKSLCGGIVPVSGYRKSEGIPSATEADYQAFIAGFRKGAEAGDSPRDVVNLTDWSLRDMYDGRGDERRSPYDYGYWLSTQLPTWGEGAWAENADSLMRRERSGEYPGFSEGTLGMGLGWAEAWVWAIVVARGRGEGGGVADENARTLRAIVQGVTPQYNAAAAAWMKEHPEATGQDVVQWALREGVDIGTVLIEEQAKKVWPWYGSVSVGTSAPMDGFGDTPVEQMGYGTAIYASTSMSARPRRFGDALGEIVLKSLFGGPVTPVYPAGGGGGRDQRQRVAT